MLAPGSSAEPLVTLPPLDKVTPMPLEPTIAPKLMTPPPPLR